MDPEIREQMRKFELMEQAERNAALMATFPKLTSKLSRQNSQGTTLGGLDSPPHLPFRKSWLFSREGSPNTR